MSIDPLTEEYEDYTPYQFASNQPVHAQEIEGLENAHDLNKRLQTIETRTIVRDNIPQTDKRIASTIRSIAAEGAYTGIKTNSVRIDYNKAAKNLDVSDVAGRKQLKVDFREKMPAVTKAALESKRPIAGEMTKTSGTANKTNVEVTEKAGTLGKVGKGLVVVGATASVYNIANADNKVEATAVEAGSWGGAIAGGELLGTALAPTGPYGAAAGAIVGSVIGGIVGENVVKNIINPSPSNPTFEGSFRAEPGLNGCFLQGTNVLMADGSEKAIENVNVGEFVMSYNLELFKLEPKEVKEKISPIHNEIIKITFSNGIINNNTLDHPYFVINKGWASYNPEETYKKYGIIVDKIKINDKCNLFKNGELIEVQVQGFEIIKGRFQTYNLNKIEDNHNFFANGILVHNKF